MQIRYNYEWIKRFGEIMIMQMPEDMQDPPPNRAGYFGFDYRHEDDERVSAHLRHVQCLRQDARGIY